jgi:peptidylprolyl isomerase
MSQHAAWSMIDAARRRRWPRATLAPAMLATLGLAVTVAAVPAVPAAPVAAAAPATLGEILAASPPSDWRRPDPAQTLYLELPQGRVVFELAPAFAPRHLANLRALVRERWFDGLAINRVQDNFVVQWGDPGPGTTRPLPRGLRPLAPEFVRAWTRGPAFVPLRERDGYAPEQGFLDGFAVAADPVAGEAWIAHCYGTLAVGRDEPVDSGTAAELYVVIGHAPRQLERNATVLGRALAGMEILAALPRGAAAMGFYDSPAQRVPITALRFGDELPAAQRLALEVLRTDSATFARVVEARRNRRDAWYVHPAGHIDLCSVPLPVRRAPP